MIDDITDMLKFGVASFCALMIAAAVVGCAIGCIMSVCFFLNWLWEVLC